MYENYLIPALHPINELRKQLRRLAVGFKPIKMYLQLIRRPCVVVNV